MPNSSNIQNIELAKHLLTISLIFGKYPGMQTRSSLKAINLLAKGINERSLNEVFEYLFVGYENPKILTHNLVNLGLEEIDILMFTLQGNNIRNHPDLPVPISKKESYLIVNQIPYLEFKDDVIKRSAATAKLMMTSCNSDFLQEFYAHSRIFKLQVDTFIDDIDFWRDAYNLLSKVDWGATRLSIGEFMDYFEYMKYHSDNANFSLKRRTINSVSNAIDEWRKAAEFTNKKGF